MKLIYLLAALICTLALLAGCGDQFRTETKVDSQGTVTRTITFFFAVEAETLEEAKAALNLDRFSLPPNGRWEKAGGGMLGLPGEIDVDTIDETPTPQPQEVPEDIDIPAGPVFGAGSEGWQYVVTVTYQPGAANSDFTYKFPGSKEIGPFSLSNEFQVTTKKRADGSTEYVFTEKVADADLDQVLVQVFSGAFVQPILDELGEDASPEVANALRAVVKRNALEMVGSAESMAGPPSGGMVKEIFKQMFMEPLAAHVGEAKAEAVLTRIARRALRPNYMLSLMGDFLKAAAKIDDISFLQIADEVTMPGEIESVEGGMQMGNARAMWTYSPMAGEEEGEKQGRDLKIVSVVR